MNVPGKTVRVERQPATSSADLNAYSGEKILRTTNVSLITIFFDFFKKKLDAPPINVQDQVKVSVIESILLEKVKEVGGDTAMDLCFYFTDYMEGEVTREGKEYTVN